MKFAFRLFILASLCLSAFQVLAQQTKPAELLYRSGDTLFLADITAGTSIALPNIKTSSSDRWYWSPDGRYLLGKLSVKNVGQEIRIYDVENQEWLNNFKQQTNYYAVWSPDNTQIAYATNIKYDSLQSDGQLWIFDLKTNKQLLLYQTKITGDRALTDTGIGNIWWSPDGQFLLFEEYVSKMGNADTGLNLISADSKTFKQMKQPWRGGFNPIWSPDSKWFLLDLPDTLYFPTDSADKGDVILYGINDRIYGLTNTPDVREANLKWLENGKQIQFEANKQLVRIELQDVINNPTSFEQHLSPLPQEPKRFGDADFPSPDGQWIAYLIRQSDNTLDLYVAHHDGSQVSKLAESVSFLGWRPF